MTCSKHPWAIVGERGCPTCGWSTTVEDAAAADADRRGRQMKAMASSTRRTTPSVISGPAPKIRRENPIAVKAREMRERAIPLLRQGLSGHEVSRSLGMSRNWCSKAIKKHPDMRRAQIEGQRIALRNRHKRHDEAPKMGRPKMTEPEVREVVEMRDAGMKWLAIAAHFDRRVNTVRAVYRGWVEGTSRVARYAKINGTWDVCAEAAE